MTDPPPIELRLAEHRAFVHRLALALLGDPHAADDVAQDTWLAALTAPPGAIGNLRTWLAGVVRNRVRMHHRSGLRRRRRELAAAGTGVPETGAAADAAVERMQRIEALMAALGRLHQAQRSCLVLRYYEGASPREIADRLGEPVETVKSRLKRALQQLRIELAGDRPGAHRRLEAMLVPLLPPALGIGTAGKLGATAVLLALAWLGAAAVDATGATAPASEPSSPHRVAEAAAGHDGASPGTGTTPLLREGWPPIATATDSGEPGSVGIGFALLVTGPPVGLASRLTARLYSADPRLEYGSLFARVEPAESPFSTGATATPVARYRVAFGAAATRLRGGPDFLLELRDEAGYWLGRSSVRLEAGASPVPVRLTRRGVVAGTVTDRAGTPVDQAEVQIRRVGATGATDFGWRGATDGLGAFRLRWIPAGDHALEVTSLRHLPAGSQVLVREGATSAVDLQVDPAPADPVEGALRFAGDGFRRARGRAFVVLTCEGAGGPRRTFTREVSVEGEVARFRFDGIAHGTYRATVHTDTFHRWEPESITVRPPQVRVDFFCRDDGPERELRLVALDVRDLGVVREFDVFARLDGRDAPSTTKVRTTRDGGLTLVGVPEDAALEWVLRAHGFGPIRGTVDDFTPGRDLVVGLLAGWGNTVYTRTPAGEPLEGVEVLLDGKPAGRTDRRGALPVFRDRAARTVGFHGAGLVLTGGDAFADGRFEDLIWGITGVLSPREQRNDTDRAPLDGEEHATSRR